MSKPLTMTEIIEGHLHLRLLAEAYADPREAAVEASMRGGLVVADLQAAGYGSIAEAAHKARRETLAEVQSAVRGEMDSETATQEEAGMLSLVDGFLANLQIAHARQDPEGRALAEGILERKAAEQ